MSFVAAFDEIFRQFTGPRFAVRYWDSHTRIYGQGRARAFTLVFEDEATARRLLSQGALGFGESYMAGSLRVEGDLEAYLRLRHQFKHVRKSARLITAVTRSKLTSPLTRTGQIRYHYDLGNEFFGLLLDRPTMSYSAGHFKPGVRGLAAAQAAKLRLAADWLDLPAGASVLDIGSGWGGFASYAAAERLWKITGQTLSRAQLEYCERLIRRRGLDQAVQFEFGDMIANLPIGQFDGIVMLESVEHVGKARLGSFFRQLHGALRPHGTAYLQFTGRYKPRQADAWTLKYVFPGGYLPAIGELISAAGAAGFKMERYQDDTTDYLRTMGIWIDHLERHQAEITDMFDEPFYRLWELWMHGAKVAFEVNAMNLFRLKLRRIR